MLKLNAILLSFVISFYILLLNTVAYHSIKDLYYAIPIAILFFILLLIFRIFGKFVFKIVIATFILFASIVIFFKWRYNVTITSDIILSGLINDKSLTSEMASVSLVIWVIFTALIPIVLLFKVKIYKNSFKQYFQYSIGSILLVLFLMYLQGYKYRAKGQIRDYKTIYALENFSPIDLFFAYKKAKKDLKILKSDYKNIKVDKSSLVSKYKDSLIVVVIGETSRGDRFSLNGYKKNTNPNLSKLENLYSFKNAKSCDTLTVNSMHYIFTKRECKEFNSAPKGVAFTREFKALGYKIHLYTLQTLNAFYNYLGYDKMVGKYRIINEQKVGTKDIALLPYIKKDIENYKGGKELLIIHTLGSHQTYIDRLANSDKQFKPICHTADVKKCPKSELDNTFDDTIIAVDNFLTKTINMLKNKNAMLVYFSDHGESLGENGVYFHGAPVKTAPKEQFNVPIIFWFSNEYKSKEEYNSFTQNFNYLKDKNITHDYLYHSILGCSGIKSKDIKENLNLCKGK